MIQEGREETIQGMNMEVPLIAVLNFDDIWQRLNVFQGSETVLVRTCISPYVAREPLIKPDNRRHSARRFMRPISGPYWFRVG